MPSAAWPPAPASRSTSAPATPAGYSTTLPNTATATSTNNSPGSVSASATDTVLATDLTISKVGDPAPVNSPNPVHFTITVSNTGAGTAYDVNLSDPLPDSADLNWTIQAGDAGTISGGTLSDAIGSLAPAHSVTSTLSGRRDPAGHRPRWSTRRRPARQQQPEEPHRQRPPTPS